MTSPPEPKQVQPSSSEAGCDIVTVIVALTNATAAFLGSEKRIKHPSDMSDADTTSPKEDMPCLTVMWVILVAIIMMVVMVPIIAGVAAFNALDRQFGWDRHIDWFDDVSKSKDTPMQEKKTPPPVVQNVISASPYDKGQYSKLDKKLRDMTIEWGNGELADFGEMFDQWSDLIDDIGTEANNFPYQYSQAMKSRLSADTERSGGYLTTLGFNPYNRCVELIRRGDVTIAVLIAKQGNGLYVSWRAYVKGLLSMWRIAMVAVAACLALLVSGALIHNYNQLLPSWQQGISNWPSAFFFPGYILVRVIVFEGMLRRRDWWGWFRDPVIPLQHDNAQALSLAVHRSILTAADATGIESAKLQPRQAPIVLRKPLI